MRGDLARRMPCRPMSRMSRTGGAPGHVTGPVALGDLGATPHGVHLAGPEHRVVASCGHDRSRFAGRHRAHSWHWAVGCGGRSRCSGRSRRRRRPASRRSARPRTPPCARRFTGRSAGWAVELRRYRQADALRRIALARPRLAHLLLQLPDPPRLIGGGSRPVAPVDLGLPDPSAQGLGVDSQPLRRSGAPPPWTGPGRPSPPDATSVARSRSSNEYFLESHGSDPSCHHRLHQTRCDPGRPASGGQGASSGAGAARQGAGRVWRRPVKPRVLWRLC